MNLEEYLLLQANDRKLHNLGYVKEDHPFSNDVSTLRGIIKDLDYLNDIDYPLAKDLYDELKNFLTSTPYQDKGQKIKELTEKLASIKRFDDLLRLSLNLNSMIVELGEVISSFDGMFKHMTIPSSAVRVKRNLQDILTCLIECYGHVDRPDDLIHP